jgi:hypothetical protein
MSATICPRWTSKETSRKAQNAVVFGRGPANLIEESLRGVVSIRQGISESKCVVPDATVVNPT